MRHNIVDRHFGKVDDFNIDTISEQENLSAAWLCYHNERKPQIASNISNSSSTSVDWKNVGTTN